MFRRFLIFTFLILACSSAQAFAQTSNTSDASKQNSYDRNGKDPDLSEGMRDMRQRWKMREEEKDHKEMLERTDSAARLTDELNKAFAQNNSVDAAKLLELEKLLKKVRKSLNGDDDDDDEKTKNKPATTEAAIAKLAELGAALNAELKEASRYELSAGSIENINEMLELIAFIRAPVSRK